MSQFRKYMVYIVLILVSIVLLFCIFETEKKMDREIKTHHLRYTGAVQGASPLVSFTTVALGSLRGIISDLLWLRSQSLQQKGDYYEMVQLARWITDLQPEFSGAAAFLAWNMAYNISVTCSFYDDRWRWVNEGLKLLRDRAIIYNPEDPVLYKELGWIFQHKIGNVLDDAQQYYKNQLANDMRLVVTQDPDWQGIADAPASDEDFLKTYPENSDVRNAITRAGFLTMEELHRAFRANSKVPDSLAKALGNNQVMIHKMDNFLRAQYLRDKYKLDPDMILELNNKYGKLDWRLPEAQAIYWATMGLKKTPGNRSLDCERMITQGLFEAFRSGRMLIVDNKDFKRVMIVPNFDVLDAAKKNFDETIKANEDIKSFTSAKNNFMKDAIMLLFNYGKFAKAREYYAMLQKENPGNKEYAGTLDDFAMKVWLSEVKDGSYKKTMDIIDGLLKRSFTYIVYGDDDAAIASEKIAKAVYAKHQTEFKDVQRLILPAYTEIKKNVLSKLMTEVPPSVAEILKNRLNFKGSANPADNLPGIAPGVSVDKWDTSVMKKVNTK
ncbi:MAG: hypothetical protein IKB71_06140 [Lentisphaeria bacterium]|nr:hypothetical protein [Lentisphaeria bacterium]